MRQTSSLASEIFVVWRGLVFNNRSQLRLEGVFIRKRMRQTSSFVSEIFVVWRGLVFKKRSQLRLEGVFIRKRMRQAASLVIAAWLEMCKEQQSSGPFAIVSCQNEALGKRKSKSQSQFPHAINKWNEGILKIVKIYEIRQKYIFKLWRSLKDERDTNESVVVHFGLMLLTKIMHPWRRLCCARNIYRKSSVCVVGNLSQHLVLRGLRLLKTIFLVWLALTQYRGSKNRCVKWVLGRPHSKHTEKYFCQWVAACFYAKMLKGRVLKARICLQKNQVEIAFSTWYSIAVGRSFQRGAVLRRVLIRSRRQMLEAFCEWQSAVLAMLAGKKQQRIFHTRRRIVCKRKTHEALHEWRSAIVDCKLKNRCLSKAQFTVQLVRISNFFRQWELVSRHNHRTRKLLSIRKSRMTIARKVNLATLLLSSWLSIIIERKNRERKVARKLFWKTNALKRLVWQHLYSFCTGARLIRNKTQSKISSMRHRLVQKSFTVFVRLNKALSRERLVQNKKSIAKNAAAWISHVRRGKWRRQVIISCSERKSHRLLDCCFAKWITSVNAAYRDAEIDALSASQWRMRVLARAFDQWRRSVESNIRWHAYVFSKIIPMNRGWYSRLTELVSCFSILKYWALEGRLARLHGRICGKIRRYREMENYRGSFLRLAAYCKRRHTLRARLEQACAVRVRGCMRAAISTWSDRWLSSQSRAQVLQVVSFCTRGSRESGIKRTCFLKFSQSLRLHRFTRCRARTWLRSKFRAWDVHVGIKRALSKQSQVLKSAKYCLERERCKNIKRFVIACWFQKAAGSRRLQTSKSKAVSWQQNRGKQETFTAWCEAVRVRNMLTMKRATRRLTPESSTWTSILHKMDARRECKQLQVIISWRQMLKCKQMCVNNLVKHISFIIMMWSATIKRLKWILSQVKHMNVCRRECELSRTFGIWADTNAVRRPKLMALFCKIKRSNQIACLRRMLENLHKYASIKKRNRVQLLRASNSADLHGSVFLDLVLDMSMSDIAGRQDYFKDIVIDDVADSIGGRADLIHCVALEAGSIIVHLRMEEGVCGMNRRAQDVVKEIIAQAAMPHSKLKGGHYTCTAKDVKVVSSSAAVHRYILLRRAKSRVLQLWRSYVDQKSGHREFIGQTTKKCLKNILMDVFAIWCVIQKEGRIRQLSLQLEAKQFLHQQVSNTFNEQATMMYDSMDSLLRTLIQKQDQGLHGTLSLKERCELQHGEITRLRQKISSTESERCAAVAGLEAEKVERQRDRERIESELQTQRIRLLAEFCDEKRRLKERRLEAFEMRKGSERVRCKQELAFSCLSYHARRKSKLLSFEEGRRHRCMAQALCWFAILSKQRRQEEMLEQLDGLLGLIRESVNEASRMGRNLLENRPQDATTPRRKYQEIVPLPPSEGRGLQLSGRRFFVREVEPRKPEEPREYQDIVNSARNLSVMILEVSEQNRARVESRVSQDTAYKVLKQRIIRLVAEVQQRSKGRHRMQQIVAKWHGWASYRHARALGHERMCIRFQQHKTVARETRAWEAFAKFCLQAKMQKLKNLQGHVTHPEQKLQELEQQVHDLLSAQEKHVVELQARNIQVLTLEDTAVSQAKIIEDMRRQVRDVGTAHDRDVIELQACKENSLRQAQLIADLQQQVKDARGADESEGAHAKDGIELQECKENSIYQAQLIADLQQQIQDARGADESERAEQQNDLDNLKQVSAGQTQMIEDLQRQLQDTEGARNRFERELRDSISETARLRGNEMQLKAENSAIKNECSRLRSYESSIAMIRNRVDELQTREDAAGKEILSLQGKLAASQKVLQQTQQMLQQSEDNVRTIAVKKTELEGVVQTLTASLSAFQTDAFASMEMLRAHNVDLSKKLVETESLARPLSSVLEAVHLDLYDFIACEAAVAQVQISSQIALKQENDDLRSSLEGFNANLEGFKIDQIDQALRCGLERVLSLRGHVMTLEAEKQTLRGECIRLRSAEQSLCTFRARLSEMQSREEDGQQNLLSLQKEKRNVERRLAEANESLRKSDVVIKHLTQDKVDLESELELQRIVNASLRRKPDEKQDYYAQEQLDHANAPQRPHENVNEDKNVLADDDELTLAEKKARDDKLDILPMPVSLAQTQHTDELFAHGERGGGLLHASQSEIDRGKLLTAVGELQDSLSARARRSRPCTPRLHPPSRDAGLGAEEAHLPRQEDVETEKQRAIQAAIKLRTSRCSK